MWGFYCVSEYVSFFFESANICKDLQNSADLHRFSKIENLGSGQRWKVIQRGNGGAWVGSEPPLFVSAGRKALFLESKTLKIVAGKTESRGFDLDRKLTVTICVSKVCLPLSVWKNVILQPRLFFQFLAGSFCGKLGGFYKLG